MAVGRLSMASFIDKPESPSLSSCDMNTSTHIALASVTAALAMNTYANAAPSSFSIMGSISTLKVIYAMSHSLLCQTYENTEHMFIIRQSAYLKNMNLSPAAAMLEFKLNSTLPISSTHIAVCSDIAASRSCLGKSLFSKLLL